MMNLKAAKRQRGITFLQLLLGAVVVVILAVFLMKVVPAFVENRTIVHILDTIAHDPDMQNALPTDIRTSYDKRALINNITVVTSDMIQIDKPGGNLVLSVKYSVKIPLVGNASLVLDFDASSSRFR